MFPAGKSQSIPLGVVLSGAFCPSRCTTLPPSSCREEGRAPPRPRPSQSRRGLAGGPGGANRRLLHLQAASSRESLWSRGKLLPQDGPALSGESPGTAAYPGASETQAQPPALPHRGPRAASALSPMAVAELYTQVGRVAQPAGGSAGGKPSRH